MSSLTSSPPVATDEVGARTDLREMDGRLRLLVVLFTIPLLGLIGRLWHLQIQEGDMYFLLANNNFVRTIELSPERGAIYDARGRVVAENRPSYDVYLTPYIFGRYEENLELLARILNLSIEDATRISDRVSAQSRVDHLVRRDISRDQLAELQTRRTELPGVYVRVSQRRYYPYDHLAGHLFGFMNEIRVDELERLSPYGYRTGDYVGRTGLERAFEAVMRGAPGRERQVINVLGQVQSEEVAAQLLGEYRRVDPIPGRNLHLTVDMQLQAIVEQASETRVSGGIVALDPRDGSILAIFSKPGFNPNAWSGRLSEQEQRLSDNNPFHPMLDKSVQSWFPGSTYKIITGIAALEEGIVTPETTFHCPGYMDYGDRRFHCWNRRGHGWMNLDDVMAESCDIYFYMVGLELGIDRLAAYAAEFGFGERPGLGFNGESAGVVPTREWHQENTPGGFQFGFTVNTSVGQGDTRTSPLQLALAYAALSNGGTLYYPRIVDRITNYDGTVLFEYPRRVRRRLPFREENRALIIRGLAEVMSGASGTARAHALPYMEVGGKTGTAQVRSLETVRLEDGEIVFRDRDHAWFVAFAPLRDPQIVVAVFLEHGGQGSSAAAPVAMEVIDRYFREVLGWNDVIDEALATGDFRALNRLLSRPSDAIDADHVGGSGASILDEMLRAPLQEDDSPEDGASGDAADAAAEPDHAEAP